MRCTRHNNQEQLTYSRRKIQTYRWHSLFGITYTTTVIITITKLGTCHKPSTKFGDLVQGAVTSSKRTQKVDLGVRDAGIRYNNVRLQTELIAKWLPAGW